jgi:3-hydroxy-3-methylglutaryl CoA synthase
MAGISAYGAYIPRLRLQRSAIAAAHQWSDPSFKGKGKGERAIANWDEDAITMAVEAARDCLAHGAAPGTRRRPYSTRSILPPPACRSPIDKRSIVACLKP